MSAGIGIMVVMPVASIGIVIMELVIVIVISAVS